MTNTQQSATIFLVCAVLSGLGSLLMILTPIFVVIAFFGIPIGLAAALIALRVSGAQPSPMTAQIGLAGVVAGTTAVSLVSGALSAIVVFLVYLGVVSYIVYIRLKE